jgi:hypothetical protein
VRLAGWLVVSVFVLSGLTTACISPSVVTQHRAAPAALITTTTTTTTTSAPPLTPAEALADIPSYGGCHVIDMKTGLSSPSGPASLVAVQLPGM